jgi:hypothetical protein
MSAPSPPPDNSMQIEMMRQDKADKLRAEEQATAAAKKQELAGLRTSARDAATGQVGDYFSSRGIDPSQYQGSIASQLNTILGGISPTDEAPGSAFANAGAGIYDTLQTGERTKASGALDRMFAPNFQTQKVPWEMDDPYLKSIEDEQYSEADNIIKNMMDRGVLTSSGYASAQKDLEGQRAGARSRLNEVGTGLLSKEQSALSDIANRGRQAAGQLQLGQQFDPYSYQSEADKSFTNFLGGLGDNIRAGLPGKLFNTAGLAAIGGAGQGAGNTAYNPTAAGGIVDKETDEDTTGTGGSTNPNSIF